MRSAVAFVLVYLFGSLPVAARSDIPVFPGAEGHGVYTAAGRGGTVMRVTSCADNGPGSLRAAIDASGPRVVVFEISGNIDLSTPLVIENPYITIAGQTAPAPGITVRYRKFQVATHDVLVQHLRFRVGAEASFPCNDPFDGLQIGLWQQPTAVYNVVVDHCSISWAMDENVDVMSGVHDITLSNNIIAEPLRRSVHTFGAQCSGAILGDNVDNITIFRNVWAHNHHRNPKFTDGDTGVFVNNIVYNGNEPPDVQPRLATVTDPILLTVEGNLYKIGEVNTNANERALEIQYDGSEPYWRTGSKIYIADNKCFDCSNESPSDWNDDVIVTRNPPEETNSVIDDLPAATRQAWPASGLTVVSSGEVEDSILAAVGAFPEHRDPVDESVISDVISRTGTMIDCVGPGQVTLDGGNVVSTGSGGTYLVVDGAAGAYDYTYVGYSIRITNGIDTQTRSVVYPFEPGYGANTKRFNVDLAWSPTPDDSYTWEVFESCAANGGGWPSLAVNERGLATPANPDGDADSDGYTNLEEWLHTFPRDDAPVVSNFDAYVDSSAAGNDFFKYQFKIRAMWTTNELTNSMVQYRVHGTTTWYQTTESSAPATNHMRVIPFVASNVTYDVRAVAINHDTGLITYGDYETITTNRADIYVWGLAIDFNITANSGVTATLTYSTAANSCCKINLRKEQSPTIPWGLDEFSETAAHASPHSHEVTGLSFNTVYHAYIQVCPNSSFGVDDTVFPDGAVPGATGTVVYISMTTPTKTGSGGRYEFTQQTPRAEPVVSARGTYLIANYPNPFNPTTTVEYNIVDGGAHVNIAVYNIQGMRVRTLLDAPSPAGSHQLTWDGRDESGSQAASGVYFLRMTVSGRSYVRRMILLK